VTPRRSAGCSRASRTTVAKKTANWRRNGPGSASGRDAKIVSHSKITVFQMAEVAVPEKLFRSMLSRIHRLGGACARSDIDATKAWDIERGSSNETTIAVIDSGIDLTHPNLSGRL